MLTPHAGESGRTTLALTTCGGCIGLSLTLARRAGHTFPLRSDCVPDWLAITSVSGGEHPAAPRVPDTERTLVTVEKRTDLVSSTEVAACDAEPMSFEEIPMKKYEIQRRVVLYTIVWADSEGEAVARSEAIPLSAWKRSPEPDGQMVLLLNDPEPGTIPLTPRW